MNLPLPPVLVVDDDKNMRRSLSTMLTDEGYAVRAAESAEEALKLLAQEIFFMVITDARLGGMSGYDFLTKLKSGWPDLSSLMITAYATPKLAVEAIKAGAIDYLSKPFEPEELFHAVARCAERHRLLAENAALRSRAGESFSLDQIVGDSPKMRELRQLIRTVAATDARVLVLGESGTGKELVAGSLHSLSARRNENYIRINCAAIPEALLESELFGHEKGAFTGAIAMRKGRFEVADGGTIFLDEIGDISAATQVKLLRVLQEREFERVGGHTPIKADVRILTATSRNLEEMIEQEKFRADLYYRLNVFPIYAPPLRERKSDLLLLSDHFIEKYSKLNGKSVRRISTAAIDLLLSYHWPGNVRELENCIERSVLLAPGKAIEAHHLPPTLQKKDASEKSAAGGTLDTAVAALEYEMIVAELKGCDGNMAAAARKLGLTERQMGLRVKRLGIDFKRFRRGETAAA